VKKIGLPLWERWSVYSWLLELNSLKFLLVIALAFIVENIFFTAFYLLAGAEQLQGLIALTEWGRIKEVFFFSTQTFTTVGYGRINPGGDLANFIASAESFTGLLSFALVTGLLYGRFSRPKAYLQFSEHALISPYRGGIGLMFRIAPYKQNHHLTDARVVVNVAFQENEENKQVFKFYTLNLERSRIDAFNMNWTVVHPIDEESPLLNFTLEDMQNADLELYVQVTGFDHIFSNMVMQRTSYTYKEIIWGAKFKPMYKESGNDSTTYLLMNKLNEYDRVSL
jgi:inward rectifier potassium channel